MAKVTASEFTATDAAREIAALINSSPCSPYLHQLTDIIAKVQHPSVHGAMPAGQKIAEWREHSQVFDADLDGEWHNRICFTKEIWNRPVEDFEDLLVLVEVSKVWNSPCSFAQREYPLWVLDEGDEDASLDQYALAKVVEGILTLAERLGPACKSGKKCSAMPRPA